MRKNEFLAMLLQELSKQLEEGYPEMELEETLAPNGEEAITIVRKDTGLSPAAMTYTYMYGAFDEIALKAGLDQNQLSSLTEDQKVRCLAKCAIEIFAKKHEQDDCSKEAFLQKTQVSLLNKEEAMHYNLERMPHLQFGDMVLIYETVINERMSFPVENRQLDRIGISREQLHQLAMKNSEEKSPPVFTKMENGEYVVTADHSICPAAAFLYDGVLDNLSMRMGSDLYIILMRNAGAAVYSEAHTVQELSKLLVDYNSNDTTKAPVLSNCIFKYDRKRGKFDVVGEIKRVDVRDESLLFDMLMKSFTHASAGKENCHD